MENLTSRIIKVKRVINLLRLRYLAHKLRWNHAFGNIRGHSILIRSQVDSVALLTALSGGSHSSTRLALGKVLNEARLPNWDGSKVTAILRVHQVLERTFEPCTHAHLRVNAIEGLASDSQSKVLRYQIRSIRLT